MLSPGGGVPRAYRDVVVPAARRITAPMALLWVIIVVTHFGKSVGKSVSAPEDGHMQTHGQLITCYPMKTGIQYGSTSLQI